MPMHILLLLSLFEEIMILQKGAGFKPHCWEPTRITGTCDPWLGTQLSQGYHCLWEAPAVDAVCGSVLQWLGRCIAHLCALLGQCSLSFTFREIQITLVRLCLAMCQEWCRVTRNLVRVIVSPKVIDQKYHPLSRMCIS